MSVNESIAPDEELGRSVGPTRVAKRARRKEFRFIDFMPGNGEDRISLDRVTIAPEQEIVEIAELREQRRTPPHKLHGWIIVTAEAVMDNGCAVNASPQDENCYHADVIFPQTALADEVTLKERAQDLADAAAWHPRPILG